MMPPLGLSLVAIGGVIALGGLVVVARAAPGLIRKAPGIAVLLAGTALGMLAHGIETRSWGLPRQELVAVAFGMTGVILAVVGLVIHLRAARSPVGAVPVAVMAFVLGFLAYAVESGLWELRREEGTVAILAIAACVLVVAALTIAIRTWGMQVETTPPTPPPVPKTPAPGPHAPVPPDQRAAAILDLARNSGGPASPFVPPTPEELGSVLTHVTVEALIGSGGMGAVYRARRKDSGEVVALKILPRELAEKPGFQERFAREAKILAGLHHPHLVAIHDAGQDGGWCWLMMELVEGANLREVMRTGRLSPEQALRLVPQLCDALQYAHDHGVVHRDIKPENILLDAQGRLKLTDFGLAKLVGPGDGAAALTRSGAILGTVHYMAPEQVEGGAGVDHRADIYAVGVVLYEMLTGGLPLGRFLPPSQQIAVDVRVDEVVFKALEKDPQRRYQQANDVRQAVEAAHGDATPTMPTAGPTSPSLPARPGVLLVAFITLLVLITWLIHWMLAMTATVAACYWFYRRVVLRDPPITISPAARWAFMILSVVMVVVIMALSLAGVRSKVALSHSMEMDRRAEMAAQQHAQSLATTDVESPANITQSVPTFITSPGTYRVLGERLLVTVLLKDDRLIWSVNDRTSVNSQAASALVSGGAWFVFPQEPARVWIYDGSAHLTLVEKTGPNRLTTRTSHSEPGIVQEAPTEVRSRLPDTMLRK